ncbi:MAG: hypothetical protein IKY45_03810 [Clostridia bacterium]|nr:hypothetical protein [Clostridia bacterium]MBR4973572.1 hypothetical protein [Clostridia bacterium]
MDNIIFAPIKVKKISNTLFDLGINVESLTEFMNDNQTDGWIHINICKSKDKDAWYGKLNTWKPNKQEEPQEMEIPDEIPF